MSSSGKLKQPGLIFVDKGSVVDSKAATQIIPSAVLHLKNVPKIVSKVWVFPSYYNQGDIQEITDEYGPSNNIVVLRPKEQVRSFIKS